MLGAAAGSWPVSHQSSHGVDLVPAQNASIFAIMVRVGPTLEADHMMQTRPVQHSWRSFKTDDAESWLWRQRRSLRLFNIGLHCSIFLWLWQWFCLGFSLREMLSHQLQQLMVLEVRAPHLLDLDSGASDLFDSHGAIKDVLDKSLDGLGTLLGQVFMLVCKHVNQESVVFFWFSFRAKDLVHVFSELLSARFTLLLDLPIGTVNLCHKFDSNNK
jgi:hypothetical protein